MVLIVADRSGKSTTMSERDKKRRKRGGKEREREGRERRRGKEKDGELDRIR